MDLIVAVLPRSGGQGGSGVRGGSAARRSSAPRWSSAGAGRNRHSGLGFRAGFGSERTHASCVIQLATQGRELERGTPCAAAGGVTLCQGASPANGARPSEETEALSI